MIASSQILACSIYVHRRVSAPSTLVLTQLANPLRRCPLSSPRSFSPPTLPQPFLMWCLVASRSQLAGSARIHSNGPPCSSPTTSVPVGLESPPSYATVWKMPDFSFLHAASPFRRSSDLSHLPSLLALFGFPPSARLLRFGLSAQNLGKSGAHTPCETCALRFSITSTFKSLTSFPCCLRNPFTISA